MWPHDLKLHRARQHLKELNAQVDRWVEVDGYTVRVDPDPEPPQYVVKALILRPIKQDPFSLLIGDFLQNARAALDYIAFALGEAGARGAMPDNVEREAGFPIVGDVDRQGFSGRGPDLFAEAANRRLATVTEPARAVIKQLQPYYTDGSVWMSHPLWILNEMARFDRHRFLQVAAVRGGDLRLDPDIRSNARIRGPIESYWGRVFEDWDEEGTPIATELARVTAEPVNPGREVHMHFQGALEIGWDDDALPPTLASIEHDPIMNTFISIERHVGRALGKLAPFLPPEPPY